MFTYRDMTFCVNQDCKKRCFKFLTPQIEQRASQLGMPVAVAEFICLDCGSDGVYKLEVDEDEEMS